MLILCFFCSQDFMEKTIVLALATGQKQFSVSMRKLVEECAETLACQGILTTAKECLNLMGTDESSPELMILQDCITWSTHIEFCHTVVAEKEVPKSSTLENSQSLPETTYEADQSSFRAVESSGQYHQETAPSQLQHSVSGSPYGGNYQPSFGSSCAGGYGAPVPYQPAPNPQMFLPSQPPQVPQLFTLLSSFPRGINLSCTKSFHRVQDFYIRMTILRFLFKGTSIMEASLHKLQAAMAPLTEETRICIRDACHRLAKDSEQRHSPVHGNTSRYLLLENTTTEEPKTNSIDKVVATLLWSQRQVP
ncbi:hypothetical protein RHSIM_Rhsim02G0201000 [Rhododendron simsii]|uniref:Uncharacterized protein n=1 Tax=Rhododendron simsii TaxID=118357 RepID=A0A834LTL6_RHOSS|nr:hypothetical protein RHSIM_Rhsim02G0201000 [Rhododendron simsii]